MDLHVNPPNSGMKKRKQEEEDALIIDNGNLMSVGESSGSGDLSKSSTSGSLNSNNPNGSNSDNSCQDDEDMIDEGEDEDPDYGSDFYYNDDIYEDDYSSMQDQFDSVDLPPGVEASLPWLKDIASSECKQAVAFARAESSSKRNVEETEDTVMQRFRQFKQFDTVDAYSDHFYDKEGGSEPQRPKNWAKKIQEEWKILEENLPVADLQCSKIKMPRRPRRRCQRLKTWPITFSPFARALAHMASVSMAKRQMQDPEFIGKPIPSSASNGFMKRTLEEKPEQSESSDEEFDGVVQADFSFFDPKPDDFHGVKTLLQTYLDGKEWDLSGFVDLILGQTTVGTVVKIEDDEDEGLFACVTALNLWRYKEQRCIMELKDFLLLQACQEKGVADQLRLLLEEQARNVGLLVSQRVVNLPPQLLPPLYDALFDEVSWATEDEPTEELQNSFQFKHYIILSKIYKHKNVEQKRKPSNDSNEVIIYIKPEDEIFHKLSSWSFSFPLQTQQLAAHELKNYRSMGLLMAVEAGKIPTFRQELVSLINET